MMRSLSCTKRTVDGAGTRSLVRLVSAVAALAAIGSDVLSGQASTAGLLRLGSPTLTVTEPFSEVVAVATLADGRLLVADRRERTFYLVTRDGRSVTPFGRNGNGPNEYQGAFGIVRMPGDTLALYGGLQRFLRVTPNGTFAEALTVPQSALRGGFGPAGGVDASGALYWIGDVVGTSNGQSKRNQLHIVRRWRPGAERIDSVARVADHAPAMHQHRFHPFAERDAWVVAPDGRVGVLSAAEYRLRWFKDGRFVSEGPALPFERVPVTAADRATFRLTAARQPAGGMRATGPRGEESAPSAAAIRRMEEYYPDASFPAVRPPFIEGGAHLTPGGDVWVVRAGPASARAVTVDVLTATGELRARLTLPEGRRLVGVERSGIHLARVDDDGLQWLERYDWPSGLK